jgi:excinuclease Cho
MFILPRRANSPPAPNNIPPTQISQLPTTPGVYIFRNRRKQALYIGKSINIRSRVASHLRNGDQAALLAETTTIDHIETAGEIGALLQESMLIKKWQPRYNIQLLTSEEPWVVASLRGELGLWLMRASEARAGALRSHGMFASYSTARHALAHMLKRARLCLGLSGMEEMMAGRGCFARQLGQCRGACIGHETLPVYRRRRNRALAALEDQCWPYAGPIGIVEQRDDMRELHVIDHWSFCGSIRDAAGAFPLQRGDFDADVYRIVAAPLQRGELQVLLLSEPA